jgi:hypothetical protein
MRTFVKLAGVDLGFDPAHVLVAGPPATDLIDGGGELARPRQLTSPRIALFE